MDGDIAVIGVGSMGSFALWQLASKGKDVIGFERFVPGHDKGSGHGESRIFRTAYGEGPEFVPFLKQARKLWKELESETNTELYTETGSLMIGDPTDGFLDGVLQSAKQYDLPHELLDAKKAKDRFPQHEFEDTDIAYLDPLSGFLRPELAVQTAASRAAELGARIYCGHSVTAIETDTSGVTIHCDNQKFRVDHCIVSTGAWTSKLLSQIALPVWVERQVLFWYPMRKPEFFGPERFPIFVRVTEGYNWYGFPTLDGKSVKIAFHHNGCRTDPDTIDRSLHEKDSQLLSEYVDKYIPGLIPTPEKGKVCMYANTPDNHFVLGSVPEIPNVTLLGPMAGHGFKFAPIMGKLAAEIAMGLSPILDIDLFSPERFEKMESN